MDKVGSFFFVVKPHYHNGVWCRWIREIEEDIFDGKEVSRDWIRLVSKEGSSCIVRGPDWGNRCSS